MKRAQLLKSHPCREPERQSDDVLVAAQVLTQGERKVLNLDMYFHGRLKGRYFADREEMRHALFVDGKWHVLTMKNAARVCRGKTPLKVDNYYIQREYVFASREDEETALGYLERQDIRDWEEAVHVCRAREARIRKKEKIKKMMADVPHVPEEAEKWVVQQLFPGDILFLRKEEGRITYSCTACGAAGWKKTGWRHGAKIACPKCGKPVAVNIRQQEKVKKKPVIILQAYGGKWIERQFSAVCRWAGNRKTVTLLEQCRAVIPEGETWGEVWYGQKQEADEYGQDFWDKNPLGKRFVESYLYPGNLREVLKCGDLDRSGLAEMAEAGIKVDVNIYITSFHQRPWIEYLVKAGLTNMAAEIMRRYRRWGDPAVINRGAETLGGALRLDGNRTNRMKQINGGLAALEWLQYEEKEGIRVTQEALDYLSREKVDMDDCREILEELGSVTRMVNYMKKQGISPRKLVQTWRDYLRMARAEGYDTDDDIVRFPKDLKMRHDQLVEAINARNDEEKLAKEKEKYDKLDMQIREHLPEAARYRWEDEDYVMIPAGKCRELIKEGRELHHCVGSSDIYMRKMAKGQSWILFLRKRKEPERAYYTVEIDMEEDRILQWYSAYDRKPDYEAIKRLLDKYTKSLKREREKIRVRAVTA